jgi:hypothetical protein
MATLTSFKEAFLHNLERLGRTARPFRNTADRGNRSYRYSSRSRIQVGFRFRLGEIMRSRILPVSRAAPHGVSIF